MLSYNEWLRKKQKMSLKWYRTMILDKRPYKEEYDRYKKKALAFQDAVQMNDIEETAKELVALGSKKGF